MNYLKQTEQAIEDMMSESDECLFNDDDINLMAQEVDADIREIPLDDKIYDTLIRNQDYKKGTL